MFGNGFDRRSIVNAHVLRARLDNEDDPKLSHAAHELCDVPRHYRFQRSDGKYSYLCDALDALEFEDVACFFAMLAKRDGWKPYERPANASPWWSSDDEYDRDVEAGGTVALADAYSRAHAADGVTIVVQNSDDDPTRIDFHVQDRIANAWADRHGSLDGGTWETSDGEEFVYDSTYWRAGLLGELQAEGFRFDFSQYGEPDEHDLEVAKHAAECDECEYDWHKAEDHLSEVGS